MALLGLVVLLLLRFLNRNWWQHKLVRWLAYTLPLCGALGFTLWIFGTYRKIMALSNIGLTITLLAVITLLALILSLPISGIFNLAYRWAEKRALKKSVPVAENVDKGRRLVLRNSAAIFPIMALSAGGGGLAGSYQQIRVYLLQLQFDNLPPELEGFRILHLSDSHLGIYKTLDDLEEVMTEAEKFNPDIVLYTGDVADNLTLLPEALKLAASSKAKYGAFACLGNHEYYRGINQVLKVFDDGPVQLMKNSGVSMSINGKNLYLAGVDDPATLGRDITQFLKTNVVESCKNAPSDAFSILMSHRPEGFDVAAESGVNLVLSGHTHGGQVGLNGRSIWEVFAPSRYLWGKYARNGSQMYLTSGIGHWLPFRLGCPPEAPIIELVSGNRS